MKYRPLGKTGLQVSAIGLDTWQFSGEWGHSFSQPEVDAILDQATVCGVNLIDTAECYGDHLSEAFIGNYLSRHDRSRWIVATKFGHNFNSDRTRTDRFSSDSVRLQLEMSLKALRTDYVDLYQFHSGSDAEFQNEKLWTMLAEQKRAGRIRYLGVSILGKGTFELQAREAQRFDIDVIQVIYNRLDRRPEQLYFPHAERDRLGVLARVPLASGLLTGKYGHGAKFPQSDWRSRMKSDKLESDLAEVERLKRMEIPSEVPMAQWALAWCLKNSTVSAVIPGCKDPSQLLVNCSAVDFQI